MEEAPSTTWFQAFLVGCWSTLGLFDQGSLVILHAGAASARAGGSCGAGGLLPCSLWCRACPSWACLWVFAPRPTIQADEGIWVELVSGSPPTLWPPAVSLRGPPPFL